MAVVTIDMGLRISNRPDSPVELDPPAYIAIPVHPKSIFSTVVDASQHLPY
jgi:hypothetical protein